MSSVDQLEASAPLRITEANITDVEMTDDRISFSTDAIGVPHLVKVSYFPNWQATGAEGPYHAGPSFMVVVPTSSSVTLSFGNTAIENIGWILTVAGMASAALLLVRSRASAADQTQVRRSRSGVSAR